MAWGFNDDKSKFDIREIRPGDRVTLPFTTCFGGFFDDAKTVIATIPLTRLVDPAVSDVSIDADFILATHGGFINSRTEDLADCYATYDRESNSIKIEFVFPNNVSLYANYRPVQIVVIDFNVVFS